MLADTGSGAGRRKASGEVRILHVMDKLSVDGSRIAGPARQLAYRLPRYPGDRYRTLLCSLRQEEGTRDFMLRSGVETVCLGRSKFDLRVLEDLRTLAVDWRPDLLHLHGYASWTFGRIVARWKQIPAVVQEHFIDERVPAVQKVADRLLARQQQFALAVSEAVLDFMTHERFVRGTPTEVIWNTVPVAKLKADAAAADTGRLRLSLNIPPDVPVVGIVGRLAEMKGHRYFLEAAARIRHEFPDARFVIVGDGPLRAALEEQAKASGLSERLHFTGHQDEVVPYLAMFDVCVLTSTHGEGFHTVALESLAVGTPVVTTDLPTFRGLYTHDTDVLIVPVMDSQATAAAAVRLLTDGVLRTRLLENAQRLLDKCSPDAIVRAYLDVYDRVLSD